MLKQRIIPVLTFNGISLVKTKKFNNPRIVGNPIQAARIYNNRNVDELIFIDINASPQKRNINLPLVKKIIDECFMPVTIGGGIETFDDINNLLKIGADKVLIKSKAFDNPDFISSAVDYFGSQCISISVDTINYKNSYWIYHYEKTMRTLEEFIDSMIECQVGELVINAVHNDGMQQGFDCELYNNISSVTNIPLVALGGAGSPEHFSLLAKSGFNGGLAAASIFHFTQFTPLEIKKRLKNDNIPIRI